MKGRNLWLCVLMFPFISHCQKSEHLSQQQTSKLDSIATMDVPKGGPGIAVGIVMNGNIVYEKYAGYADLNDSIYIDRQSRFNIASNGKQFTALAILSLIEEGKLSLQDDIRDFLPTLYPNVKSDIRISHLLNHMSGIRDVYDLWSLQGLTWWEHTFDNNDALVLLAKQEELNFKPGAKYSYSNSNYILLAEIIGKVSGTSFITYTDDMFKSLNMPNTSFISNYKTIDEPIAKPYFNFDTWFGYDWIWNIHGDGNIFSTLKDQMQWERTIQTKRSDRFSKEVLEKSQSLLPNSTNTTYGYGVEFGEYQNIPYKFHGGSTGAWKAISARFPTQDFAIITLTNSGKIDPMLQTLKTADVLLGKESPTKSIRLTPEKIGNYVSIDDVLGHYKINNTIMQFVEREGDLYLLRSGRNDMKLIRESDNVFQQWNDAPFKQEFFKNEKGEMQVTFYYTATEPFTLTRIESDFSSFDFASLNGTYLNKETSVSFSVVHKSDETYLVENGDKEMKAFLLTPNELIINDYGYRISINKNSDNMVSDLFLTSGRIQNVRFSKVE